MSWGGGGAFCSKFDPKLFAATSPDLTKNFPRGFCDISFPGNDIHLRTHPRTVQIEQKQRSGPGWGATFTRNVPNDISPGFKGSRFFQGAYYDPLKLFLTFYNIIVKRLEVISMSKLGLRSANEPF